MNAMDKLDEVRDLLAFPDMDDDTWIVQMLMEMLQVERGIAPGCLRLPSPTDKLPEGVTVGSFDDIMDQWFTFNLKAENEEDQGKIIEHFRKLAADDHEISDDYLDEEDEPRILFVSDSFDAAEEWVVRQVLKALGKES